MTEAPRTMRVMIFCMGLETVRHTKPMEHFLIDKAYMLYLARKPIFEAFRKRVTELTKKILREDLIQVEVKVYDFADTLALILDIVRKEREQHSVIYINIDGPPVYASAAMVAAMMEDCQIFYSPTLESHITDIKKFQDDKGNLVGLTRNVNKPVSIPKLQLQLPPKDLVQGLRIWRMRKEKKWLMSDKVMIEQLLEAQLMDEKKYKGSENRQNAKMYYRRHFVDEWKHLGWITKDSAEKWQLTEEGKVATRIFYLT